MDKGVKEISVSILEDFTDDRKIMDNYLDTPDSKKKDNYMSSSKFNFPQTPKSNNSILSKIKNIFKSSK